MDWDDLRDEIVGWLFFLGVLGLISLGIYETFIDDQSAAPARIGESEEQRRVPYIQQEDPSAVCKDGTYSYSRNDQGSCSWHGGVDHWLD